MASDELRSTAAADPIDPAPPGLRLALWLFHHLVVNSRGVPQPLVATAFAAAKWAPSVPGASAVGNAVVRLAAKMARRSARIDILLDHVGTKGLGLTPEFAHAFDELLGQARAASEVLTIGAIFPLIHTYPRSQRLSLFETVASFGHAADLCQRTLKILQRETLVTRLTEHSVLPALATIEGLALVATRKQFPRRPARSLGEAQARLRAIGVSAHFIDDNLRIIRNSNAHHTVAHIPGTSDLRFTLDDGTIQTLSADAVARTVLGASLMPGGMMLRIYDLVLRDALRGTDMGGAPLSSVLRNGLKRIASGDLRALSRAMEAAAEQWGMDLRNHCRADELASASEWANAWRSRSPGAARPR